MPRSRLSPFLSVLLVFLSGVGIGVVGYRLYIEKASVVALAPSRKGQPAPEEVRKRIVAHMRDAVKLDDNQVAQLQAVMDETRDSFLRVKQHFDAQVDPIHREAAAERDKIHDAQAAKVRAFLRPDQIPLYEKYLADRASNDRKRREQQQQGGIKQQ
jgi:hypothetical protein